MEINSTTQHGELPECDISFELDIQHCVCCIKHNNMDGVALIGTVKTYDVGETHSKKPTKYSVLVTFAVSRPVIDLTRSVIYSVSSWIIGTAVSVYRNLSSYSNTPGSYTESKNTDIRDN